MIRLLGILSIVTMLVGCASLPEPDFHPKGHALSVVTYNVNWGGAKAHRVLEYLTECDADVICLQETHREWEAYLKRNLSFIYPHSHFHHSGGAGGIAFMSKTPLKSVMAIPATQGWFPALHGVAQTELGPVQLLNVHLRPPLSEKGSATLSAYYNSSEIHQAELKDFLKATDPSKPLIIAGDFNENEKRAAVKGLLELGYSDALSLYDDSSNTWFWKLRYGFTLKNRYDHLVFNSHLTCTGAKVTHIDASDHMPVFAVFVAKPSAETSPGN